MLRGAMYRATSPHDIRFAEKTIRSAATASAEQRRKAARLPITLPATIVQLDEAGRPFGEDASSSRATSASAASPSGPASAASRSARSSGSTSS
jgi:hypothetical protein